MGKSKQLHVTNDRAVIKAENNEQSNCIQPHLQQNKHLTYYGEIRKEWNVNGAQNSGVGNFIFK